jgi:hypothetical protein
MFDEALLSERLTSVLKALERIPRRFAEICKNDIPVLIDTV